MIRAMLGTVAVTTALAAAPALADEHETAMGDPAAGETAFAQCQTCHVIRDDDGEVLAGRVAQQGPNLYGVIGRTAGVIEGFKYRDSIVEAGAQGLVWDRENLVPYLLDPNSFLQETLDNRRARSGMSHRVRNEEMARDLVAFLAQFGAVEPEEDAEDETEAEG